MTIGQKIRKIWHDLYYKKPSAEKVEFAMRCRDVAHQVDFQTEGLSLKDQFRFRLHLSLCQACHNYYMVSKFIRTKMHSFSKPEVRQVELDLLTQKLIEIHQQKNK